MTDPGAPRRGRHSSADDSTGGFPAPWPGGREDPSSRIARRYDLPSYDSRPAPPPTGGWSNPAGRSLPQPGTHRSGLMDPEGTGPLPGAPFPVEYPYPAGDRLARAIRARHSAGEDGVQGGGDTEGLGGPVEWPADGYVPEPGRHPSAPIPPRPPGVWDRFPRRAGNDGAPSSDEAPTEAHGLPADVRLSPAAHGDAHDAEPAHDDATDAHPREWQEQTGGLEVIGAHVDGRRGRRRRRAAEQVVLHDGHADDEHYADGHGAEEELALHARDRGSRRRPLGVLVVLLLLVGVVAGVLLGGRTLLGLINPASEDFAGAGTGTAEIRVEEGDTLSDIAQTLVDAGVIASVEPFVDAAEANSAATGIQPGIYRLRQQMSGQAALDLMLDPAARQVTRVTIPEGLTVAETLQRLADETGVPLEQLQAAAADPAALGAPAYSAGTLEGYLFPATYDFEPDTAPVEMLRAMVAKRNEVAADLQLEQRAAAAGRTPAEIVVVASMVEAETRLDEERADVAQVIYNRLAEGIPLGIDATLAYGLDKNGNDLTVDDLQTDSPYNTRTRTGLPPTPISGPGRASLEAALQPSTGNLLYYVLESKDGSHFFTDSYSEFQQARQRCAAAGLGCGG